MGPWTNLRLRPEDEQVGWFGIGTGGNGGTFGEDGIFFLRESSKSVFFWKGIMA